MNTDDRLVDGPGPNNNNQQMQFDNETIKLEVSGFDQNANMNDVIGFLKTKKQFHYKEVTTQLVQCHAKSWTNCDTRSSKASIIIVNSPRLCSLLSAVLMRSPSSSSLAFDTTTKRHVVFNSLARVDANFLPLSAVRKIPRHEGSQR